MMLVPAIVAASASPVAKPPVIDTAFRETKLASYLDLADSRARR